MMKARKKSVETMGQKEHGLNYCHHPTSKVTLIRLSSAGSPREE